MNLLNKYTDFIAHRSRKDFIRLLIALCGLILAVLIFLIYLFFHQKHTAVRALQDAYKQRNELQLLIEKNNEIKRQKEIVSQLLEKNNNFKLIQFFDVLVDTQRLGQYVADKRLTTTELEQQSMLEIELAIQLRAITMQQLVLLLQKIEENERVYFKKLEIRKAGKLPAIDVDVTIATLQLKSE